ncbi:pyruvate formate-lyase activating enzyme [Dialister sp. CAG:588]|nr:pyruvate formate-lyase activating enzyme [Dialister sp. CAG:588]
MSICNICPRACNIHRKNSMQLKGDVGYCHVGMLPIVARATLHHWEEPCISGERGAGTVFFVVVIYLAYIVKIMKFQNY